MEKKVGSRKKKSPKLYVNAKVIGYRRAKHVQRLNTTLIQIDNVMNAEDANFYIGKFVAYIYKAKKKRLCNIEDEEGKDKIMTNKRVLWGKILKHHGKKGALRAKFKRNLPPTAHGKSIRVMLYPSNI